MSRRRTHDTEVEDLLLVGTESSVPAASSRSNTKRTNYKCVFVQLATLALLAVMGMVMSMQSETIERAITSLESVSVTKTGVTKTYVYSNDEGGGGYNDDDLRTGKSCYYKRRRWHCRDCGGDSSSNGGACRKLRPKGQCAPFKRIDWDHPPRFTSEFNPTATSLSMQTRTLSYQGKYYYHGQPLCTVSTCFNLSRCTNDVLTVYVNTTGPHALLDYAAAATQNASKSVIHITRVSNHQDACLVLVTPDLYSSASDIKDALHWQEDGRNHILWKLSQFRYVPRLTGDGPFPLFHIGHAAVASESLTLAQLRMGYDMALSLARKWGRTTEADDIDIHRKRKWLLSFRGSIQNSWHPYYPHPFKTARNRQKLYQQTTWLVLETLKCNCDEYFRSC